MGVMTDLMQSQQRLQESEKQERDRERKEKKIQQKEQEQFKLIKDIATRELTIYFTDKFDNCGIEILEDFYNIALRNHIIEKIAIEVERDFKRL